MRFVALSFVVLDDCSSPTGLHLRVSLDMLSLRAWRDARQWQVMMAVTTAAVEDANVAAELAYRYMLRLDSGTRTLNSAENDISGSDICDLEGVDGVAENTVCVVGARICIHQWLKPSVALEYKMAGNVAGRLSLFASDSVYCRPSLPAAVVRTLMNKSEISEDRLATLCPVPSIVKTALMAASPNNMHTRAIATTHRLLCQYWRHTSVELGSFALQLRPAVIAQTLAFIDRVTPVVRPCMCSASVDSLPPMELPSVVQSTGKSVPPNVTHQGSSGSSTPMETIAAVARHINKMQPTGFDKCIDNSVDESMVGSAATCSVSPASSPQSGLISHHQRLYVDRLSSSMQLQFLHASVSVFRDVEHHIVHSPELHQGMVPLAADATKSDSGNIETSVIGSHCFARFELGGSRRSRRSWLVSLTDQVAVRTQLCLADLCISLAYHERDITTDTVSADAEEVGDGYDVVVFYLFFTHLYFLAQLIKRECCV